MAAFSIGLNRALSANPMYTGPQLVANGQSPYEAGLQTGTWQSTRSYMGRCNAFETNRMIYGIYSPQTYALRPVMPQLLK